MKVLLETEKADIRFNPETRAIEVIWKKVHDDATYKLVFTKGVEFLKEYSASAWLSDIRQQGVVGPANAKWLQTEVIPQAIKAGLKRIAVVMDKDVFKQFYVKNIQHTTENSLMQNFDSTESANAWLKEN